jgi:diadenosine tetraphosphate (Ap4A) HIT family hydrolase
MMEECRFCEANGALGEAIVSRNAHCLLVRFEDPVLESWLMILPIRHVETPFDLSPEEWVATGEMLGEAQAWMKAAAPDGYTIGWTVHPVGGQTIPHAHLHVIGRFADEPLAGKGLRHALKQPENRRGGAKLPIDEAAGGSARPSNRTPG